MTLVVGLAAAVVVSTLLVPRLGRHLRRRGASPNVVRILDPRLVDDMQFIDELGEAIQRSYARTARRGE